MRSVFDPPPTQDYSTEERAERGRRAREILDDPIFQEAQRRAEREILQQWLEAKDPAAREAAWAKIHAQHETQRELHKIAEEGLYAQEVLRRRP